MTPDTILSLVAKELNVVPLEVFAGAQVPRLVRARHLWWYLWALYAELPDAYPNRNGKRPRRDTDGAKHEIARRTGYSRRAIIYGIARTEDRRDDPDFDRMVRRLELLISVSD